ncbi:hypothetical protein BDZ45DRAFT_796055 [Acephala macrosclerotiorum]|nr:hypothetical protein BDZ45DRAFT_796055 [Acephala macrosclerotiorum]
MPEAITVSASLSSLSSQPSQPTRFSPPEHNAGRQTRIPKDPPSLKPKKPKYVYVPDPEGEYVQLKDSKGKLYYEEFKEEQVHAEAEIRASDIASGMDEGNSSEGLIVEKTEELEGEAADTKMADWDQEEEDMDLGTDPLLYTKEAYER